MKSIFIYIDNKKYFVGINDLLIKVMDEHGIYVPRFCYHSKLSISSNCRMCLVEIKGVRRPSPACSTPVNNGMIVFTKSIS